MPKKPRKLKPQRQVLIDMLEAFKRQPTDRPWLEKNVAISMALSMMVPGPAGLIHPNGLLVRLILIALERTGWKIVPR